MYADVVDYVPGADQEWLAVLSQQLEKVLVRSVAQEARNGIWKINAKIYKIKVGFNLALWDFASGAAAVAVAAAAAAAAAAADDDDDDDDDDDAVATPVFVVVAAAAVATAAVHGVNWTNC